MNPEPTKLSDAIEQVSDRLGSPEHAKQVAVWEARRKEQADLLVQRAREEALRALWAHRGKRYESCRLDTFQLHGTPAEQKRQADVLGATRTYQLYLPANIEGGVGILLTGREGTGKDHLLAALMRTAVLAGRSVRWISGAVLRSLSRDAIRDNASERMLLNQYIRPDVLVLSDPMPIQGPLTQHQRETLYDIIDARYNHLRPTWASLNAISREEADAALGSKIVGRLRDRALSLVCDWQSFRKPVKGDEL